ncbi:hypothetical protein HER10_EVM0010712 [Colletotrichum scovillei]|uniref:Fungal specific transcription factor domain-containing protein n=1 Tax=Colletotrichum scovillei TaxID=1209932 RepID=A0A9P7UC72_9PEZI|nr:uncharacterized protein HER10_EVM0010712 [Colletotrichum scovillei]KAF4784646.1 hypothetical protein HER10_EVM0010712 [Colletotrichum scovillei]KAG7040029.1 Fungal specific transcription factor domain-containing protein [Colletotrichum scovillei]KAG7042207.1 Fungal specific transcription factor domain-containing protein [Colletotrichum scovillei]KAG7062240.1 Fungal specific transcription factor domain-containing protein [Colletotrichum scovillei]
MMSARPLVRSTLPRATRAVRAPRQQLRFQSTTTSSSTGGSSSHFGAGVAGGLAGAGIFYALYSFTPAGRAASKVNKAAKEAEKKYTAAAQKLQENTPSTDEAIDYIKQFAYSYVGWIPGGRSYVDSAFNDFETVRKNHKEEADKIVDDAYKQFQEVAKAGLSLEAVHKAYEVLADITQKLASLGGDAIGDILDNHPQLKEKLGGNIDQLKDLGDKYGPEAKKQVDETWKQVKDVLAGGLTASNFDKVRKLIEEKIQQVQKLGDEAWKKALEEAKPYLDKNPKVKELIEKNADALKKGNAKELFEKAKKATESGDLGGLESYVTDAVDKAKSKGSQIGESFGLDQYFKMIPDGDKIIPKLKQLREVADKHKEEGEKLFKETIEEVKKVLEAKSKKAEEIAEKAKKDAK